MLENVGIQPIQTSSHLQESGLNICRIWENLIVQNPNTAVEYCSENQPCQENVSMFTQLFPLE